MSGAFYSASRAAGQAQNASEDPESRVNHSLELIRNCDQDLQRLIQLRSDNLELLERRPAELERVNEVITRAHEGLTEARRIAATCRPKSTGGSLLRRGAKGRQADLNEFLTFVPVISRQNAAVLNEMNHLRHLISLESDGDKGPSRGQQLHNVERLVGLFGNTTASINDPNLRPRSPMPPPNPTSSFSAYNAHVERSNTSSSTTSSLPPYTSPTTSQTWSHSAVPPANPSRMSHEPHGEEAAQFQRHSISEGQRTSLGSNRSEGPSLLFGQNTEGRGLSFSPTISGLTTTPPVSRGPSQTSAYRPTVKPYQYPTSPQELPVPHMFSGSTSPGSHHEVSGVSMVHELPSGPGIRAHRTGTDSTTPVDGHSSSNSPFVRPMNPGPYYQGNREQYMYGPPHSTHSSVSELPNTSSVPELNRAELGSTMINDQAQRPPLRTVPGTTDHQCSSCRSLPTTMDFDTRTHAFPQEPSQYGRGDLNMRSQTSPSIMQYPVQYRQDWASPQQPHGFCTCGNHSQWGTPQEPYKPFQNLTQQGTHHAELPG